MQQLTFEKAQGIPLREKISSALLIGFTGLWFVLYLARVFSANVAYASVVACFVFVLFVFIVKGSVRTVSDFLLVGALFFTCVADIFMGFLKTRPFCVEIGVTIFTLVQVLYSLRITVTRKETAAPARKRFWVAALVRAISICITLAVTLAIFWKRPVFKGNEYLFIITTFYITISLVNAIYAFIYAKHNPLVPAGLVLLLVCDVLIGLMFLGLPLGTGYFSEVSLSWIFYLPSQTILALSMLTERTLKTQINQ